MKGHYIKSMKARKIQEYIRITVKEQILQPFHTIIKEY